MTGQSRQSLDVCSPDPSAASEGRPPLSSPDLPPVPDAPQGSSDDAARPAAWWFKVIASFVLALASGGGLAWALDPSRAACWILAVFGALQLGNTVYRLFLKHHTAPDAPLLMALEFALGGVLPLAVGVIGLIADLPEVSILASAALVAAGGLSLAFIELELADVIDEAPGLEPVSSHIGGCKAPYKRLRPNKPRKTVLEVIQHFEKQPYAPPVSWIFGPAWGTGAVSGARWLMLVAIVLPAFAFGVVGVSASAEGEGKDGQAEKPDSQKPDSQKKGDPESGAVAARTPAQIPADLMTDGRCVYAPGDGLPSTHAGMRGDFLALFGSPDSDSRRIRATPPLGLPEKCVAPVQLVKPAEGADVAYQLQWDSSEGRIASIAITSAARGPALFYWPAVMPILDIIEKHGAVGGVPEMTVGSGDLYLVHVDNGTIVLIRRRSTKPSGGAEPYLELPLAVGVAWAEHMRHRGEWLWPAEARNPGGTSTYYLLPFATATIDEAVGTIEYDASRGVAKTQVGQYRLTNGPDGAFLSEDELRTYADTAQ